jgi:hypothetical protein
MFVILILGCLIAFLFSILEFLWNIRKVAVEEKVTHTVVIYPRMDFIELKITKTFKIHASVIISVSVVCILIYIKWYKI